MREKDRWVLFWYVELYQKYFLKRQVPEVFVLFPNFRLLIRPHIFYIVFFL